LDPLVSTKLRPSQTAHLFKHQLPAEIESGLGADQVYDHPYTTMPSEDRKDLGVFYPFMGHACHIVVVEVDVETGLVDFLSTRRCTIAAPW
jgi:hypothetical protein